jgi:hypothetical protein
MSRSNSIILSLYAPGSCVLFVIGEDDDATTCVCSRGVAKLTEQRKSS